MEIDFQLLIYIIFVLVAIGGRLLKKKKKDIAPEEYESTKESKPISFEELLKEFTQETDEVSTPKPVHRAETKVEEAVPVPIQEYEKSLAQKDAAVNEAYEAAKYKEDREPTNDRLAHFKGYQEEEEDNYIAEEVRDMLSEPDSAAKAIILGEILNRKYA